MNRRDPGATPATESRPPDPSTERADATLSVDRTSMVYVRAINAGIRVLMQSAARVRIDGLRYVPRDGPLIVATNHLSYIDPPVLGAWLIPALGRPIFWLTKAEALEWPVVGPLLARYGCFPVRRGAGDAEALRLARDLLRAGGVVSVFPEGTRSHTGALGHAKPGIAMLAFRTGAPVLPVAISGADRFMPNRGWVPHPGATIHLRVGPPYRMEPDPSLGHREALETATADLMVRLARLLPPRHRGEYADGATRDPMRY